MNLHKATQTTNNLWSAVLLRIIIATYIKMSEIEQHTLNYLEDSTNHITLRSHHNYTLRLWESSIYILEELNMRAIISLTISRTFSFSQKDNNKREWKQLMPWWHVKLVRRSWQPKIWELFPTSHQRNLIFHIGSLLSWNLLEDNKLIMWGSSINSLQVTCKYHIFFFSLLFYIAFCYFLWSCFYFILLKTYYPFHENLISVKYRNYTQTDINE